MMISEWEGLHRISGVSAVCRTHPLRRVLPLVDAALAEFRVGFRESAQRSPAPQPTADMGRPEMRTDSLVDGKDR